MFAFLKRTFLIFLGFLLIVVFVWFAGPYFAFADYRPLEPPTARVIVIGIIVGIWLAVRLVKRLRAFRASDKLLAAVAAQRQPEAARPSPEAVKLRERFEEAARTLKQGRRSGHSLYELPWYVIIGAPGSGKTTALLNSGLKFPLEQRVGKGALRGIGGTRNCDWWFTDDAIFLDTAGRYTTQDSDAASDSAGWAEFLALLKKYRSRRPINGVILTINAQDLLSQGHAAREAHVDAARKRLDELNHQLRIELPVYLMVTKCDLVAGFAEYFDDLTAEGRTQVWGVTFPYEQTLANGGPEALPSEFDALITRLNERVFERLEHVRDVRRRTKVFAFPQQMASIRDALTQFVSDVFESSRFDRRVLLRGVYFTSGTQEGTPIDRLLGSIGRRFGASESAVAGSGPGKAYFVEQLLKDVLIGESGLAGINRQLEARKAAAQLGAYAATGLVAAAGVAGLSVSYARNRTFLEQTASGITRFDQTRPVPSTAPLESVVPRLDAIAAIADSAERFHEDTSFFTRWGLYQGGSISNAARDAYLRELDGILLPRVAAQIRARIVQYTADPEKLFIYLKAYLMLGETNRLEKAHLQSIADREWRAGNATSPVGLALSKHFKYLLDHGETLRPLALDATLVEKARSTLRQTSMPRIVYESIKRTYADKPDQGLRFDQLAGLDSEKVFKRRSKLPLSAPLTSFYTRPAFKDITGQSRAELVVMMAKDGWVLGDSAGTSITAAGNLVSGVTDLYERDYIRTWNDFVSDVEFIPFSTVQEASDELRLITASSSPLRGLLRVISEQTLLIDPPKAPSAPRGLLESATEKVGSKVSGILKAGQEAAGLPSVTPGASVSASFGWVRDLTTGEPGKTPIDGIINTIAAIQQLLGTTGTDAAGTDLKQLSKNPTFRALKVTLRQQAEALPPGLRPLILQLADLMEGVVIERGGDEIESQYRAEVVQPCTVAISNRYPFATSTQPEVTLADFGKVFGYGGLFDRFFSEELAEFVDASRIPWTVRPHSVNVSQKILDHIQSALVVRDMFFPTGSKTPQLDFYVIIKDLDRESTRFVLQIDGQNLDDRHQPPVRRQVKWPGASGQAVATFEARYFDPSTPYPGVWAFFRMIDDTSIGPPDAQQRVALNLHDRYHSALVTIEAVRPYNNPFASKVWRDFRCEP